MSLIMGFNLQDSVYLASDSRLTYTRDSGIQYVKDRWRKYYAFSQHIHCVAAGDVRFASYLMQKIVDSQELDKDNFRAFQESIREFILAEVGFYDAINKCPRVAFIFAGFDMRFNKKIDMQSAISFAPSDGSMVRPRINEKIILALIQHARSGGIGTEIEVEDIPDSGIFTIEIIPGPEGIQISMQNIPHGKYAAFGEGGFSDKDIPQDLYFKLDLTPFPPNTSRRDILTSNVALITDFYHRQAIPQQMSEKKNLSTVGGTINVIWVTEHGGLFPGGTVTMIREDGSLIQNSTVIVKEKITYVEVGGELVEQKTVFDFYGNEEDGLINAQI